MWKLADKDATISFDYLVDGEFVTPTSASYRVLTSSGTELVAGALPATGTTESATIPAIHNAIVEEVEVRFVEVSFVYGGGSYNFLRSYRLSEFVPLMATPDEVRSTLGLDASELRDEEIDLMGAYFGLYWRTGTALRDALTVGGQRAQAINEAIVIEAALQVTASMPLRTKISVRSEDSEVSRSRKIDFPQLANHLSVMLAGKIDVATGETVVTPTLFALSTPTDPFSG